MNKIDELLLEQGNFPEYSEKNLITLLGEIKKGNLGINLSSFEEIFNMTPKSEPFPVGCVNFNDKKKCFVISWNDQFSKLGLTGLEDYRLKLRVYPVNGYPVISIIVGINSGKVDPETKEDLWFYGESHLDISFLLTRIKLHQLLNCNEVLFCLFDGDAENLDSYGFSLDSDELQYMADEILCILDIKDNMNIVEHVKEFSIASKKVHDCFNSQGLPKSQDALGVYLKRKELMPKPNRHNWLEYLSI